MSKMDDLRAMREARYEANQARSGKASPMSATRPKAAAVAPTAAKKSAAAPTSDAAASDGLCGHRNMSGRSCTRDQGHSEKSHRYS